MATGKLPSALDTDLSKSTESLISSLGSHPLASSLEHWLNHHRNAAALLNDLSDELLDPACTILIAIHFRPILVDLVARLLAQPTHANGWGEERTLKIFQAFGRLLGPFEEIFP